jgi:hypothetical protein
LISTPWIEKLIAGFDSRWGLPFSERTVMHPRENRIKLEACEHGKLYKLHARNIKIGIWCAETQSFIGIRTKFGSRFLDGEHHWDAPEFATASPLEVIGEVPSEMVVDKHYYGSNVIFEWLDTKEKELGLTDENHEAWKMKLWEEELAERKCQRNQ